MDKRWCKRFPQYFFNAKNKKARCLDFFEDERLKKNVRFFLSKFAGVPSLTELNVTRSILSMDKSFWFVNRNLLGDCFPGVLEKLLEVACGSDRAQFLTGIHFLSAQRTEKFTWKLWRCSNQNWSFHVSLHRRRASNLFSKPKGIQWFQNFQQHFSFQRNGDQSFV